VGYYFTLNCTTSHQQSLRSLCRSISNLHRYSYTPLIQSAYLLQIWLQQWLLTKWFSWELTAKIHNWKSLSSSWHILCSQSTASKCIFLKRIRYPLLKGRTMQIWHVKTQSKTQNNEKEFKYCQGFKQPNVEVRVNLFWRFASICNFKAHIFANRQGFWNSQGFGKLKLKKWQ